MAKGTDLETLLNAYWNNYAGILMQRNEENGRVYYLTSRHEIEYYTKILKRVARRVYPRGHAFRRMLKLREIARDRRGQDFFYKEDLPCQKQEPPNS